MTRFGRANDLESENRTKVRCITTHQCETVNHSYEPKMDGVPTETHVSAPVPNMPHVTYEKGIGVVRIRSKPVNASVS